MNTSSARLNIPLPFLATTESSALKYLLGGIEPLSSSAKLNIENHKVFSQSRRPVFGPTRKET